MARTFVGKVISDSADKTIVVKIERRRTHPLYKKQYRVSTKFMAHDETNQAKRGDLVSITEARPLSARKHFKLDKIIERAGVQFEDNDAIADLPQEPTPEPEKTAKAEAATDPSTKLGVKEPKS